VQRDRDLTAEIRLNLLDIYCRGQRLINVNRKEQEALTESGPTRCSGQKRPPFSPM
jgi:hypothetical protein